MKGFIFFTTTTMFSLAMTWDISPTPIMVADKQAEVFLENPSMRECANIVAEKKGFMHGIKDHEDLVEMKLTGIYIYNDVLYYRLELRNRSSLQYDIDELSFTIKDNKKVKRKAYQEIPMEAIWFQGDTSSLKSRDRRVWVVAFQKVLPTAFQHVEITLLEEDGGRNLHLSVNYRNVLRTKFVNEM